MMAQGPGQGEIRELTHEPWPGFRTAFAVVFAAAALYLAVLLFATLPEAGGPAGHGTPTEEAR